MQCPDCLRFVAAGDPCPGCGYVMPVDLPGDRPRPDPTARPAKPAPRRRRRAPGARPRHDRLVIPMPLSDETLERNRSGFAAARAALAEAAARADERDRARAEQIAEATRLALDNDPVDRPVDDVPTGDHL